MAIRVAAMLATSRGSAVPSSANALASQKVNVFPGFTTCAWKRNRCPRAGDQQAGLELDSEDSGVRRHQGEDGVPAGAVEDRGDDPRVDEG